MAAPPHVRQRGHKGVRPSILAWPTAIWPTRASSPTTAMLLIAIRIHANPYARISAWPHFRTAVGIAISGEAATRFRAPMPPHRSAV